MKKFYGILGIATMMAFSNCSNTEKFEDNVFDGEIDTNYLSVNLVSNFVGSTKAAADNFEDGYEGIKGESNINKIRLYFFDINGQSANVSKTGDSFSNYIEWTPAVSESGNSESGNVSATTNATLVIHTREGDRIPYSVIAVVNPDGLNIPQITSLSDFEQSVAVGDYLTGHTEGNFVMSNSVYKDNNNKKYFDVNVVGHLHSTESEALANPVVIYVERVAAKVGVTSSLVKAGEIDGVYATSENHLHKFGEKEIYVKLLGWNVTAVPQVSNLVKDIDIKWGDNLFGIEPWNDPARNRSYWALNPTGLNYGYGNFGIGASANNASAIYVKNFNEGTSENPLVNYVYTRENADDGNGLPSTPSKVIVAAQLCDIAGNPITFGEYLLEKYSVDDMKVAMANYATVYKEKVVDGETVRVRLEPSDITFVTGLSLGNEYAADGRRNYVYAQISSETYNSSKWYLDNRTSSEAASLDQINEALRDNIGAGKIWNNGFTYYYFDVEHIGSDNGKIGVVRNHIYKANIRSLSGLGTPVYNVDETIYPEKPEDTETYIAAQIKVISWRAYNFDVDLEW